MTRFSNSRRALLATGTALPLLSAIPEFVHAQTSDNKLIPIQDFFRRAQISNVTIAPDGKRIAAVRLVNGRKALMTLDLATRKPLIITNFKDADVANIRWINSDRLLFTLIDLQRGKGDQVAGGLFAINFDGSEYRPLVERSWLTEGNERLMPVGTEYHSRWREGEKFTDDIVVSRPSMHAQGKFSSSLFKLNTKTGYATLLTLGAPGDTITWITDWNNVPRVAVTVDGAITKMHYRATADAPWKQVHQFSVDESDKYINPIGFNSKGTLFVSAYAGQDNAAIYAFNGESGTLSPEPIAAVKGFDLTEGLRFSDEGELLGVEFEADRERTYWIDQSLASVQRSIDQAIPNAVNLIRGNLTRPDATFLVASYSDVDPGRYFIFDRSKGKLEQIAQSAPWIDTKRMAHTEFFRYQARDGMTIPATLTLPANAANAKNLPLVVLHYGGPWVRPISWQWDPHVQFLASRGYAVLMPAPRASTGFGWKLFRGGWKQWGLAMQDDVTDGVNDLIKRGIADPKRICLAGASYGGYLTMMGLVKEPNLFRCGINWVGVTDPEFMFSVTWTDFNEVDAARYSMEAMIGDPVKDAAQFNLTSPVKRASEIKQPVLMAYGGLDRRVPVINGEKMKEALEKNGRSVEWVVYNDEAHGWLKEENNVDFWSRVEAFLTKNLAPR